MRRTTKTLYTTHPCDSISLLAGNYSMDRIWKGYTSVIVFPNGGWGAVAFEMGSPPAGIYLRFSDMPASLKALRVHTVIVIDPDNCENLDLIKRMGRVWGHEYVEVRFSSDAASGCGEVPEQTV